MKKQEIADYKKAGIIAKQIKDYAKSIIKPNTPLNEIAEKIEAKILELGGEVAFPVNLSIDDLTAHFTPSLKDETPATGLLKADIGVHVNGFIADTAITIDLTKQQEHKKIIKATEQALANALELVKKNKEKTRINEIGKIVHKTITEAGFSPIRNLSGHSLEKNTIHAGITIPNYDNSNENEIGEGAFAIEPFATYGEGIVREGGSSGDYDLIKEEGNVRNPFAREILKWIKENKSTLPISERELERKFKRNPRLALKILEQAGIIKSYPALIEKAHKPSTQAENTVIIHDGKVEVTSE